MNWVASTNATFNANGTVTFASAPTITSNNHGNSTAAVTISQTVATTIGVRYRLDFWVSSEDAGLAKASRYAADGFFGLKVGGTTAYLTVPGSKPDPNGFGSSLRYYVDFVATTTTTALTFTNWGHFSNIGSNNVVMSAELVLDDVILVAIPEPSALALAAAALGGWWLRRRSALHR